MQPYDHGSRPAAKRSTVIGGVIFNPWVNISACVLTTLGLAWATWFVASAALDISASAPYPDQGLDIVGTIIGAVFLGLATLALVGCTIYVIIWWTKRIRRDRAQQHGTH